MGINLPPQSPKKTRRGKHSRPPECAVHRPARHRRMKDIYVVGTRWECVVCQKTWYGDKLAGQMVYCTQCNQPFRLLHSWLEHITKVLGGEVICDPCNDERLEQKGV